MLVFLTTFLAILPSILRSGVALELENLALRHQIGVLQRSAAKRPKLTSGDRFFWICLSRLWRDWRAALAIVRPETVVARAEFSSLRSSGCRSARSRRALHLLEALNLRPNGLSCTRTSANFVREAQASCKLVESC